jgi:hypothetical protein
VGGRVEEKGGREGVVIMLFSSKKQFRLKKNQFRGGEKDSCSYLPSKETYYSVKRDLLQCQKRPITVSKESYYSVKRDLLQCQKRPTTVSKETYYSVKRELLQCQKRPITVSKETYYSVKRDLLQCQKRATCQQLSSWHQLAHMCRCCLARSL